jgi:cellulose synthase/poly-beta-1,6-N-acetylglucosamine synthase-like glycosyltransferase
MSEWLTVLGMGAQALLVLMLGLILLPALLVLCQVLLALLPRRPQPVAGLVRPRVALLVPAHNESTGLLPTLAQARAQMVAGDRLLVVADNCSDDTAAVALAAGAEVSERFDSTRRGKGFALDHGVRQLAADPPEVVIVLDADCTLGPDCIARLAKLSHASGRPVQARYLMAAPNTSLKMRVAEFAMRVKNWVRPRGMHRLSLPCGLYGTGMAFPWRVAEVAPLASSHLAEDMQLGVRLAQRGVAPLLCEEAEVASVFAGSREGEQSQRTRWEHGHLSLLFGEGPQLAARAIAGGQWRTLMLVLDMLVPPLALLAFSVALAWMLSLGLWAWLGWWLPLTLACAAFGALVLAILLARARFAADIISGKELLMAPTYVLAKLPLYLRFVVRRQVDWIRTKRDS